MRFDRLTVKAQEALTQARDLAAVNSHGELTPEHLLAALLAQDGGLVPRLVQRIGADVQTLDAQLQQAFAAMPKVRGASVDIGLSDALKQLMDGAFAQAQSFKDEFVSTEHFLLAILALGRKSAAAKALAGAGVDA